MGDLYSGSAWPSIRELSSRNTIICCSRAKLPSSVCRGAKRCRKQGAVDTQGGKQALHRLKRHWSHVAADRLASPRSDDYFAYNVVSVSAVDLERIRERLRVAFREIRSLVAASQPEEVAALINLPVVTFGAD